MAGLDNIKRYATGSSVTADDTTDTADTTDTTGALSAVGKTPVSKDKYLSSLPSAAAPGAVSSEILKNLQDMIKEREAQKNSFMSAMKDATAWWSGGVHGPAEALRARDLERENEAASTFGMKNQLAQYKAAQAAAANQAQSLKNAVNPTGAGGAPATSGMPANVASEINRLLSLNPPDVAGAQALRTAWAKNESKFDAARNTQGTYFINGKNVNLTPDEYATYKQTGQLPGEAPAQSNAAPTSQTSGVLPHTQPLAKVNAPATDALPAPALGTNTAAAKDAGVPVLSGYRDNAKQAELKAASLQPGYKGPPVAAPGQSLHQTDEAIDVPDFKALKPEQLKWLTDNGYRQTLPKTDPNHFAKIPGLSAAPAQTVSLPQQKAAIATTQEAPSAVQLAAKVSPADLPYPKPANQDEVKANQEYIKQRNTKELEITGKGPEQASTEAGKRQAQMYKLNEDADKTIEAADQVIAASKSHPESVGIGKGLTGANVLVTAAGALVPKMTKEKAEQEYADLALGKEAIAARDQVITASKQLGISFAADVFKGARMGIGLENMAANAKGVSEHNLAENNLINATLIKEAALFNKSRAALFDKWKETHGGKLADFEKFETSPEYNALKEETQKKIVAQLPQYLRLGKDGLEQTGAAKQEAAPASKFDKYKKKKTD